MTTALARVVDWDQLVPGEHVLLARVDSTGSLELLSAKFVHATSDLYRRRWQGTFVVNGVTDSNYDSAAWTVHRSSAAPDQQAPSVPEQAHHDDDWHRFSLRGDSGG